MTAPRCAAAALYYAQRFGWAVLPLRRDKSPLAAAVPHGVHGATTDIEQIRTWWRRWPHAGVGIACTAFVVLDVDPRNGGDESFDELVEQLGPLPSTVEGLTGGGGRHLLFEQPAGVHFRKELAPGVDIKARGGYIVAPPTIHPSGRAYTWECSSRPGEIELAGLPAAWLAAGLRFEPEAVRLPNGGDVGESFLALAFSEASMVRRRIDATRIAVRCPWQASHTKGDAGALSSTVVFAPRAGSAWGWFHCSHGHCVGQRTREDVLAALPLAAVTNACAASIRASAAAVDDDLERAAIQSEESA